LSFFVLKLRCMDTTAEIRRAWQAGPGLHGYGHLRTKNNREHSKPCGCTRRSQQLMWDQQKDPLKRTWPCNTAPPLGVPHCRCHACRRSRLTPFKEPSTGQLFRINTTLGGHGGDTSQAHAYHMHALAHGLLDTRAVGDAGAPVAIEVRSIETRPELVNNIPPMFAPLHSLEGA